RPAPGSWRNREGVVGGAVGTLGGAGLEHGQLPLQGIQLLAGSLQDGALHFELLARHQVEAGQPGLQGGAEVLLEVGAGVLEAGRHQVAELAGEVVEGGEIDHGGNSGGRHHDAPRRGAVSVGESRQAGVESGAAALALPGPTSIPQTPSSLQSRNVGQGSGAPPPKPFPTLMEVPSMLRALPVSALLALPSLALAAPEAPPAISAGDTAWMLAATALVLFMTLPGLALGDLVGTVPESLFVTFQLTFAIITPALIVGAFAERMRFAAMLLFSLLWFTFAYLPLVHMVWAGEGGLMWAWGVIDFAGGTVVHINAGVAGLIAALVLGKRRGYPMIPMPPHNLGLTLAGARVLWVGWVGFNAGSALAANESAAMAMLVTQVATGAAALAWMGAEWLVHGKPSALGIASGVVAGLVAITPAAGTAGPAGALVIGLAAGAICFFCATSLKRRLG